MWPRTAHLASFAFVTILFVIASGCGQTARQSDPAIIPRSLASTSPAGDDDRALPASARELAHRRQIQELLNEALSPVKMDARVAAVLAASDHATGDVARTLRAIDTAMRVVIDNLENVDTIGFKGAIARVNDRTPEMTVDMTQGSLENTSSPLDVAIVGDGYFPVKIPEASGGIGYTRAGMFTVNAQGSLLINIGDGYRLVPPITLPMTASSVTIGTDGTVQYVSLGSTTKVTAGQIKLATFPNARGLARLGGSILIETEGSGKPVASMPGQNGGGQLLSGFLETSNVSILRERMRMRFLSDWRDAFCGVIDARAR